jgi:hypothetical protein
MQNPLIPIQDILTLYVTVDNCLPQKTRKAGRPSALSDSEMVTILIWCTALLRFKTIRDIYGFLRLYHAHDFPALPDYSSFVRHCSRLNPLMLKLINDGLQSNSPLQFADSTMLPVCKYVRANEHKVARAVAAFGKNHQGWHYGFKLHAAVNPEGQLCGIFFTPASFYDAQALPYLIRSRVKIVVGDGGYTARVMSRRMWDEKGTYILSPPHPKQKKKLITWWQHLLLRARPKIESVFDYLKNHLCLVSSFPRSVNGHFFNYLRNLLAYQFITTLF